MELTGKRILVTGGAGFIVSQLVDQLADCEVRVIDNLSTGNEANLAGANVELIRGDILDRQLVAELMQGTDVVFHLACRGVRHLPLPWNDVRVHETFWFYSTPDQV